MKKFASFLGSLWLAFAASAYAGDIPTPPPSVQAPFSNDIGGNLWITLVRHGKTLQDSASADALVCSTTGKTLDLAFTPTKETSAPLWFATVPGEECRCVPRPAYLLARNLGGLAGDFTGTYQWVHAGKCAYVSPKVSLAPPGFIPGPAKKAAATCETLGPPEGEYKAKCKIALPGGAGARICHAKGWVLSKDGLNFPKTGGFPERFIRLVVDPDFLNQNNPKFNYDVRASYIAPGCIDLVGVSKAWFALNGDTNVDPSQVKEMDYTIQRLLPH